MELLPAPEKEQPSRRRRSKRVVRWRELGPLAIFALIAVLGPVLFGAVDRWVQIGLVGLLAAGVAWRPPGAVSRGAGITLLVLAAILFLAQVMPWHPTSAWRTELTGLGANLPWTRHPEPMRALDALLALAVGLVWFHWVRGLAAERTWRVWMFWILVTAGVVVAVICLTFKGSESGKILGLRQTVGWVGWGPFPNRNHTASFLAMAALAAAGTGFWALAKRRQAVAVAVWLAFAVLVVALLASKSRGGLVAFGAGAVGLLGMLLLHRRNRTTWIAAGLFAVATAGMVFVFGGKVLERFTSQESGAVSNDSRRQIWHDARALWLDAPALGHGLETFPQVFPIYTQHDFDGSMVRHPESSWLLWLCEVGVIPVAIAVGALLVFLARGLHRSWTTERHGFYLTSGALAAVAALGIHAVFDVPAHRWGTAGFALALLAIALPARPGAANARRSFAIVPLVIAGFWLATHLRPVPWMPTTIEKLAARERAGAIATRASKPRVSHAEWSAVLRHFPLDLMARHFTGLALLAEAPERHAEVERHFTIVRRQAGSSWGYPLAQALALGGRFPAQAIAAWQDAVDRSGRRGHEILRNALRETANYPGFGLLWGQFIELRPHLALAYTRALIEELRVDPTAARIFFDTWWEERALSAPLRDDEIADFHILARTYASLPMLEAWMKARVKRKARDYAHWVELLMHGGHFERAWEVYGSVVREPTLAAPPTDSHRETLESQFRASPENARVAQVLAQHLAREQDLERAHAVILQVANRSDAPAWFIRKGAHILAAQGKHAEALALALREK